MHVEWISTYPKQHRSMTLKVGRFNRECLFWCIWNHRRILKRAAPCRKWIFSEEGQVLKEKKQLFIVIQDFNVYLMIMKSSHPLVNYLHAIAHNFPCNTLFHMSDFLFSFSFSFSHYFKISKYLLQFAMLHILSCIIFNTGNINYVRSFREF